MRAERISRYKEKIKFVVHSLEIIEDLMPEPDQVQSFALYYLLSTSIESAMKIIAMFIKDTGEVPKGDAMNIDYLAQENFIESDLADHLKKCNSLRNFLIHQYNGVDRVIVLDSVGDVRRALTEFIEIIEVQLNEF